MESTGKGSRQITMKEDDAAETYQSLDATTTDATLYAKSVEGYILCITGINEEAQEEDLQDAFGAYG